MQIRIGMRCPSANHHSDHFVQILFTQEFHFNIKKVIKGALQQLISHVLNQVATWQIFLKFMIKLGKWNVNKQPVD